MLHYAKYRHAKEGLEVTNKSVPSLAILSRSWQKAQFFPSEGIAHH
jgi:hypothetical protein